MISHFSMKLFSSRKHANTKYERYIGLWSKEDYFKDNIKGQNTLKSSILHASSRWRRKRTKTSFVRSCFLWEMYRLKKPILPFGRSQIRLVFFVLIRWKWKIYDLTYCIWNYNFSFHRFTDDIDIDYFLK